MTNTRSGDQQWMIDFFRHHPTDTRTRYSGETATTIRSGNTAHIFINNKLARELTIDPNRRPQPLYQRPERPT